ncbi:unnamed protein product [Polarella glacialis]|uniref:Helicase-associated domain-containing protein n=1 Tax=Polarella glacialis TaxID=89957 RepID=A0A813EHP4_POLGL|nr:unnamed protein product [Polarella glacialis]
MIPKCWDELSAMARLQFAWMSNLNHVKNFCNARGRLPQRSRLVLDKSEQKLGTWMNNQRREIRQRTLSPERLIALNSHPLISARLTMWTSAPDMWIFRANELESFIQRTGRYPVFSGTQFETSLAMWHRSQMEKWQKGELRSDRVDNLKRACGTDDLFDMRKWKLRFDTLHAYLHPKSWLSNISLAAGSLKAVKTWMASQRARRRRGTLPERETKLLASLGVLGERRFDFGWSPGLQKLTRFVHDKGRLPAQHSIEHSERAIHSWMTYQRARGIRGELHHFHTSCLNESHPLISGVMFGVPRISSLRLSGQNAAIADKLRAVAKVPTNDFLRIHEK